MAQAQLTAFTAVKGGVAATTAIAGASTAVVASISTTPVPNVRVYNSGTGICFVAFGPTGSVTVAVSTGIPIKGGATVILGCSRQTGIAVICPTGGSGTVYVTPGEGGIGEA